MNMVGLKKEVCLLFQEDSNFFAKLASKFQAPGGRKYFWSIPAGNLGQFLNFICATIFCIEVYKEYKDR
jgi:hypothetical protein